MLARSPQRDSNALTTRERIKKKTRTRMADLNDNADGYWNLKVGIEMKRQCCTTSTEIIFISTCYRAPPPFRYFFPLLREKSLRWEKKFGLVSLILTLCLRRRRQRAMLDIILPSIGFYCAYVDDCSSR